MAYRLVRGGRSPLRLGLALGLGPLLAALGCGTTFVPSDEDGAGSGGESAESGGASSGGGATDAGGTSSGGTSSGGTSSGGGMPTDAPEFVGGSTSTGGAAGSGGDGGSGGRTGDGVDCNPEHILCLPIVAPEPCPSGEVYSVESSCYGPCVTIDQCACESAADCPDPNGTDEYTCHNNTDRCGPWLN